MLKLDLSEWGPVTVLLVVLTVIAAAAGAVICIVHPATLSFESLLNDLEKFAVALGLLGVGRGVATAGKHTAAATVAAGGAASTNDAPSDASVDNNLETSGFVSADVGDAGGIGPGEAQS